jgi:hypothetical protein
MVVVYGTLELQTHDGSGSRFRVEELWFCVIHVFSLLCSNFRMSKAP